MSTNLKISILLALSVNTILSAAMLFVLWQGLCKQEKKEKEPIKTQAHSLPVDAPAAPSAPAAPPVASTAVPVIAGIQRKKSSNFLSAVKKASCPPEKLRAKSAALPVSQLPSPPGPALVHRAGSTAERSEGSNNSGIRLSAVIGEKALLSVRRPGKDRILRLEHLCLGAGEESSLSDNTSLCVLSVEPSQVTVKLGGDKVLKLLPSIR